MFFSKCPALNGSVSVLLKYVNTDPARSLSKEDPNDPIFYFVEKYKHTVMDQKELKSKLSGYNTKKYFIKQAYKLFNMKEKDIQKLCVFCQSVNNFNELGYVSLYKRQAIVIAFHAVFIILNIVEDLFNDGMDKIENGSEVDNDLWNIIHEPLNFLCNLNDKKVLSDINTILPDYCEAFSFYNDISNIKQSSIMVQSGCRLVSVVAKNALKFFDLGDSTLLSFVNSTLISLLSNTNIRLGKIVHEHFEAIIKIIPLIKSKEKKNLFIIALALISNQEEMKVKGLDILCIQVISQCIEFQPQTCKLAIKSFNTYLKNLMAANPHAFDEINQLKITNTFDINELNEYAPLTKDLVAESLTSQIDACRSLTMTMCGFPAFIEDLMETISDDSNELTFIACVMVASTSSLNMFREFIHMLIDSQANIFIVDAYLCRCALFSSEACNIILDEVINSVNIYKHALLFRDLLDKRSEEIFNSQFSSIFTKMPKVNGSAKYLKFAYDSNPNGFLKSNFLKLAIQSILNDGSDELIQVFSITPQITDVSFRHIIDMFPVMFPEDIEADKHYIKVAKEFLLVIASSVCNVGYEGIEYIVNKLIPFASSAAISMKSQEVFEAMLFLIANIVIKFPDIGGLIFTNESYIYKNIKTSISIFKPTQSSILALVSISLGVNVETWDTINEREAPPILTSLALKTAMIFAKESEVENPLFMLCSALCAQSASNSYELFRRGFIKIALSRIFDPNAIDAALILNRSISLHFFSAVSLSETFKALKFKSKDLVSQQALLDSITQMAIEDKHPPVDSFFHLSGGSIRGLKLELSKYGTFSFATTIRTGHNDCVLLRMGEYALSIEQGGFRFSRGSSNVVIPLKYKSFNWIQMTFIFTTRYITAYLGCQKICRKPFQITFDPIPVNISLGENFRGDLGPTFLFATDDINIILKKMITPKKSKISIATFFPQNTIGNRVEDVAEDQKIIIDGSAVPFVTSITDVLQFTGAFRGLISLFTIIDKDTCVQPHGSSLFLHSLLILLNTLLSTKDNRETFEKDGGFKLLGGFLSHSTPLSLSSDVLNDLKEMYMSTSNKKQMAKFIWLNYALFENSPHPLQIHYFTKFLPSLIDKNFVFDSYSSIIKQMLNNPENRFSKELEWNFFDLLCPNINDCDIYILAVIFLNKPDSYAGHRSWRILQKSLKKKESISGIYEIITKITAEPFAKMLSNESVGIRMEAISMLYYLSIANSGVNEKHISRNLRDTVTDEEAFYIFCLAFGIEKDVDKFMQKTSPLVSCDLLMLFFEAYERSGRKRYNEIQNKIKTTISNFPESFSPIFEYQNWSFVVLRFGFNGKRPLDILSSLTLYGMREEMPKALSDAWCLLTGLKLWKLRDQFIAYIIQSSVECRHSLEQIFKSVKFGFIALLFQAIEPENSEPIDINKLDVYSVCYNGKPCKDLCIPLMTALEYIIELRSYSVPITITSEMSLYAVKAYFYVAWVFGKDDIKIYERARRFQFNIVSKIPKDVIQESMVFLIDARRKLIEDGKKPANIFGFKIEPELSTKVVQLFINSLNTEFVNIELEFKRIFYEFKDRVDEFLKETIEQVNIEDHYEKFDKEEEDKRKIFERHSIKLAEVFIKENEISTDIKWKFTPKLDNDFRPIFMSVNNNYDDHRKASALRDSLKYEEAPEEEKITFKNLLQSHTQTGQSIHQYIATFHANLITLAYRYNGSIHITEYGLFFEGEADADGIFTPLDESKPKVKKFVEFGFESINFIFKRTTLYEDRACEVFRTDNKSFLFIFDADSQRDLFLDRVRGSKKYQHKKTLISIHHSNDEEFDFFKEARRVCKGVTQTIPCSEIAEKIGLTKVWMNHKISTFKYLMIINILSGRSLNDISKYPIFPWVLSDYTSETIDLNDPKVYRDLSRPLGTYNEERFQNISELKRELGKMDPTENCLYRSHMSNAGYTIGYLIRVEPFATLHISLQSGLFDIPDRLFFDISRSWESVVGISNDFRELIPQFFCSPTFLKNENNYDLGVSVYGNKLGDVILPPWAKSAEEFVSINRRALEGEIVSQKIGDWINLVFGIHRMSEEHNNLFHPFSYDTFVKDYIHRPEYSTIIKSHCANFGTYPEQVFMSPHPNRNNEVQDQSLDKCEGRTITGEPRLIQYGVYVGSDGSFHDLKAGSSVQLEKNFDQYSCFAYSKKHKLLFGVNNGYERCCSVWNTQTNEMVATLTHNRVSIECVACDEDSVVTGGSDCSIRLFSLPSFESVSRYSHHDLPIINVAISTKLGVLASIDVEHTLTLGFIGTGRIISSSVIECKPESVHNFVILEEGYIVVTSCIRDMDEESAYTTISVYDMKVEKVSQETIQGEVVDIEDISTISNTMFSILFKDGRIIFFTPVLNILKETFDDSYVIAFGRLSSNSGKLLTVTKENKTHIISC